MEGAVALADPRKSKLGHQGDLIGGMRHGSRHPFTAPAVRPEMKCLCIRKNMTTGGTATTMVAAERMFHCDTNSPRRLASPAVTGFTVSLTTSTTAQK